MWNWHLKGCFKHSDTSNELRTLLRWLIRRDILWIITFLVKTSSSNLMHFISIQNLFCRVFTWQKIATIAYNIMSVRWKPKILVNVASRCWFRRIWFHSKVNNTYVVHMLLLLDLIVCILNIWHRLSGVTFKWCIITIKVFEFAYIHVIIFTYASSNKLRLSLLHQLWFNRLFIWCKTTLKYCLSINELSYGL